MSNNNHKNPTCQFAEQTVSYLYDECETSERIEFETHLQDCAACADEIAGFGFTRSSILEWRDADFSHLAAPCLAIPSAENKVFSPTASNTSGSWFDELKKLFSFNPAFAATALVIAVVGVGIVLFAYNFSGSNEMAEGRRVKDLTQATVSPTVETIKLPKENAADVNPEKFSPPSAATNDAPKESKRENLIKPEKTIVKVSTNALKNNSNNSTAVPKDAIEKKPAPVKKQRVPNLNEADEDEDESIRLADLFAELDTK